MTSGQALLGPSKPRSSALIGSWPIVIAFTIEVRIPGKTLALSL
jgi:hypothetical protein